MQNRKNGKTLHNFNDEATCYVIGRWWCNVWCDWSMMMQQWYPITGRKGIFNYIFQLNKSTTLISCKIGKTEKLCTTSRGCNFWNTYRIHFLIGPFDADGSYLAKFDSDYIWNNVFCFFIDQSQRRGKKTGKFRKFPHCFSCYLFQSTYMANRLIAKVEGDELGVSWKYRLFWCIFGQVAKISVRKMSPPPKSPGSYVHIKKFTITVLSYHWTKRHI